MSSYLTKRALEESFKRQLAKKPLAKITIADITEDCQISRMTFYYHFNDIYDLVEWSLEEDAKRAIAGSKTFETWQEGYLGTLCELRENKTFITAIYREISRERVERFLLPATRGLIENVVQEHPDAETVSKRDQSFIADFFAHALCGITLEWIGEGMVESPKAMMERVSKVMEGTIGNALSRFR